MGPRFDPKRPFWAWTPAGGFDFYETAAERDCFRDNVRDQTCIVGELPIFSQEPGRTDLLQLGEPVLRIPGPLYAQLWEFAAHADPRWYLRDRVFFDGAVAWASDGCCLARMDLDRFARAYPAPSNTAEGAPKALVPMAARDIELLRHPRAFIEVFANGVVRAMKVGKRGRGPSKVLGYCGALATLGEPPGPWTSINTVRANYSTGAKPGLLVPVQAQYLGKVLMAAGSTPLRVASTNSGALFATENGLSVLVLSLRDVVDVPAFWAKHGITLEIPPEPEAAEASAEAAATAEAGEDA